MGQELKKVARGVKDKVHPKDTNKKAPAAAPKADAKPPATNSGPAPALEAFPISLKPMDATTMTAALDAVAAALSQSKLEYFVIGGVALSKLGAGFRQTKDLDLLVRKDTFAPVAQALIATGKFGAEKRTSGGISRLWFQAPNGNNYNVDIIEHTKLHASVEFPDSKTGAAAAKDTDGTMARILHAAKLLNLKILAYNMRKKQTDMQDIRSLVHWMFDKGKKTNAKEVYYADDDFLLKFLAGKDEEATKVWAAIGLPLPTSK